MPSPPTHLKAATTAPPSLTSTPTIASSSTTPTLPSYGPPPPPPQPPPAPNIPPSFRVSDTHFVSSTALQPKGRGGSFKSGPKFVVAGAEADMNEMVKRLSENSNDKNRVEPMQSMSEVSGSVNMMDVGFDLKQPSFLLDSSFSSGSSVDSMTSMSDDDDGFHPWGAIPSSLLTSGPNPHSSRGSNNVGALKTSSWSSNRRDPRKKNLRSTRHCSLNDSHQKKPSKNSQELVLMESKDIFTQIIQSSPPPPAPNIPKNSAFFLVLFFYSQVAEVSIAQKPARRRQAPEGNCRKQAFAIETPLRDGRVKHYFVKSEQIGL